MANGFFMSQAPQLDYRPLIQSAGAPAAGIMGGIQSGLQMRAQMQEMAAREAEQDAATQQATRQEDIDALAMQAAQGDPEAMEKLVALDPQAALQMQQITKMQTEGARQEEQDVREEVGRVGSLMATSTTKTSRAVYNRAYERIVKEGGDITDFGLPTRAEAEDLSNKELDAAMKEVAPQLEAVAMGPQKAVAPLVQVSAGQAEPPFKTPAGYMLKDPNDPNKGVKPIPGTELEKKVKVGKFTEGQTTAARYAYNMVGATDAIDELEGAGVTGAGFLTALKRGAGAIGQYAMTPEEQQYIQAQNDWIAAKLRKESGAAIPPEELEAQRKIYFPMPGDSNAVVKQKARSRGRAQKGMIASSQGAYKSLFKDTTPEELAAPAEDVPEDLSKLSDEELLSLATQ